jgi:hypothetical protein
MQRTRQWRFYCMPEVSGAGSLIRSVAPLARQVFEQRPRVHELEA